ncbi:HAD superfamily phosphatase (TIGR01681 family)/FkbH-like protein [Azospirillum baldaniorum]|uniref:HAD-IIIC family phosphatase n=1 Tax=Azospirillum baldaniorum TaxID=1064539 RepID=UPI00119E6148|nr:HAD-IIIC family phosphatase [Azospirillum baldaniorum]TWA51880.1 HAD superfamily phosphatase (TIGR01681 family)/FkbH-like protein [Azospirillum baldaniorum]
MKNTTGSFLSKCATEEDVQEIFRVMLGRSVSSEHAESLIKTNATCRDVIGIIMNSNEMKRRIVGNFEGSYDGSVEGHIYRVPQDLSLNETRLKKVLLVGSCLLDSWRNVLAKKYDSLHMEYIIFNNASILPDQDIDIKSRYDFQILQIPLRSVIPEATYFSLRYSDEEGYEKLFSESCERLSRNLDAILRYNTEHGLLSFVLNFHNVQQDPIGRMQDRYKLTSMVQFIDKLNGFLYKELKSRNNVYMIDFDQICSMFGKKYVNEDLVSVTSHGAILADIESRFDEPRLEPLGSVTALYGPKTEKYIVAAFEEARAMYRTIQQTDAIKLVIFDLDDTLWRGVPAERENISEELIEGWPIGIVEAASYLWRRGIMLAIVSKNDINNVKKIWGELYESRFSLGNFVSVAANWRPKAENISKILEDVNLLPNSVLFVDDNPVERAAVKAALPGIRVLDAPVASWRRILLWSSETQRAVLTDEAIRRTDMVQAQIRRKSEKLVVSHEDFIANLGVQVGVTKIASQNDRRFDRCFELINKTNQFNTTGVRWSIPDIQIFLENGGYFLAFEVKDKYTNYGLTGVVAIAENIIQQFVLSCRVFGMEVENFGISAAVKYIFDCGFREIQGKICPTEKNKVSQNIFHNNGFNEVENGIWHKKIEREVGYPAHVRIMDLAI